MSTETQPTVQPSASQRTGQPVAVYLQCTNLGGMEKVAYSLFERLQTRGFTVNVASARVWGPGKSRLLAVDPAARAFDYQGKFGWRSFPAFRRHGLGNRLLRELSGRRAPDGPEGAAQPSLSSF
jgi:hypothetical protein